MTKQELINKIASQLHEKVGEEMIELMNHEGVIENCMDEDDEMEVLADLELQIRMTLVKKLSGEIA